MKKNLHISFYNLILGFFIKKGNKSKAKALLDNTFLIVQKKTKKPLSFLLNILFFKLGTVIEVKKVSIGKRTHYIPIVIGPKRRIYLIIKWLKQAISLDKRKVSVSVKLADEILKVLSNKPCHSLNTRNENLKLASSNRSNIYYRW